MSQPLHPSGPAAGERNVNRATDGDVVAVELLEGSEDEAEEADLASAVEATPAEEPVHIAEPTLAPSVEAIEGLPIPREPATHSLRGRVVGIIRRNWRNYAGSLDASSQLPSSLSAADADVASSWITFRAAEKRMPPVLIATRRPADLCGQRLIVALDQWPAHSPCPLGHYVRLLGPEGDKEAETQLVLHEFGVPHDAFSPAVLACLPPPDWQITEELIARDKREDLRALPVVSIDPPGCKVRDI